MPPPIAPTDSLPFDDEAAPGEPGMGPPPDATPSALNLTSEQASQAGIMDAQPGDTYTLKVTIDGTQEGITGSVLPGSAMKDEGAMPPGAGRNRIKSPSDLGLGEGIEASPSIQ